MVSGLLGSLLGFGGSVVPAITDHFKSKQEHKFQIAKMEKAAELKAKGFEFELDMFEKQADAKESERLIGHDIAISKGRGFVSALQRSVRPVLTYSFFALFAAIEISLLTEALEQGLSIHDSLEILWDDDVQAIFAAIISFWFGSRAIDKTRKT